MRRVRLTNATSRPLIAGFAPRRKLRDRSDGLSLCKPFLSPGESVTLDLSPEEEGRMNLRGLGLSGDWKIEEVS
jgi:hypothetical protein